MKIVIVGWYGTETIGDRAILAGILKSISKGTSKFDIELGCLYPFYSQRMIVEDQAFFNELTEGKLNKISIFDSKDVGALRKKIDTSDAVMIGGGPLMDLPELNMLEYSFHYAKKRKKSRIVCGCGVGPLYEKKNRKTVANIIENADLTILRDEASKSFLSEIALEFKSDINLKNVLVNFDPAVNCTIGYLNGLLKANAFYERNEYIAVNLRSFPREYSAKETGRDINQELSSFVKDLSEQYKEKKIILVPMHYFHVGSDDRVFLNEVKNSISNDNVIVHNAPLSLKETICLFENASFCIGMRFHSVVIQTICSGKNYILDYTEPKKGKIFGFTRDIDSTGFYDKRYICLQNQKPKLDLFDLSNYDIANEICLDAISNIMEEYSSKIMGVIN